MKNQAVDDNLQVIVRVRPPLPREINDGKFLSIVRLFHLFLNLVQTIHTHFPQVKTQNERSLTLIDYVDEDDDSEDNIYQTQHFAYDFIYD